VTAADVIVVGLGVHGSALAFELARRGVGVIGVDAHAPPHPWGSTTGRTRITREAYYEHPAYVPLVQRAHEIWAELEELTGTVLLRRTGGLMCGAPDGELIRGTLASCGAHDLAHEVLDDSAIRARFPALQPPPTTVGVLEQAAGVLLVEPCLRTLQSLAEGYGARLLTGCNVTGWSAAPGQVTVQTSAGELTAAHVVLAAGPWLNALLARERGDEPLRAAVEVERQTSHWYEPAPGITSLRAPSCPITMLERADGLMLYTLPDVGHGVKAGLHHGGAAVDPDSVDRSISPGEEARMRHVVEEWMPGATYRELDAAVCLYTNTRDRHFAVGRHARHGNVALVSACSGHGFKFGPALAEVVADCILDEVPPPALFDAARLFRTGAQPSLSSSHG
jgi:sarcosine oxidase